MEDNLKQTNFKKGDRVSKNGRKGTVVYDSVFFNGKEEVQICYDDTPCNGHSKWGTIKRVQHI